MLQCQHSTEKNTFNDYYMYVPDGSGAAFSLLDCLESCANNSDTMSTVLAPRGISASYRALKISSIIKTEKLRSCNERAGLDTIEKVKIRARVGG